MFSEIQAWTIVGVASTLWLALSIVGITSGGGLASVLALSDTIPLVLLGLSIFERWVWRWPPLHPHVIPTPVVRGTWRGDLESFWIDPKTRKIPPVKTVYLAISQTMTTIHVRLLTDESASDPIVASVAKMPNGYRAIFYTYENTPSVELRRKSPPHRGGALLEIVGQPPTGIAGEYWTDRDSKGKLTFLEHTTEIAQTYDDASKLTYGRAATGA
jgi:SMODS-associating 2TM, beta-strand rich effector domain